MPLAAMAATISAIATLTVTPIATTSTSAATPSTASARPGEAFARTRFIHGQVAPVEALAVETVNGFLGFIFRGHRHEGKPSRAARHFILHQQDFLDGASLCKEVLYFGFVSVEGKIPDKQLS
jgi:hypothetical protein